MFKPLVALPRRSRWKERAQPQLAGAWEAGNMTQIVGNAARTSPSILRIGQKSTAKWGVLEGAVD